MAKGVGSAVKGDAASDADQPRVEWSPAEAYYFAEMARIPRLAHEEQIELAKAVSEGHTAEQRFAEDDFTPEERLEIEETIQRGHEARQRLFESNLRLAVFVARQYRNRGLPLADLIQEANLGLLAAIDRFDYQMGNHFSTYAYWWIRQHVTRALADRGRLIRLPVHVGELLRRIERASVPNGDGRAPAIEEVAERAGTYPERVREVLQGAAQPLPLEIRSNNGEEMSVGAALADPRAEDLADEINSVMATRALHGALANMPKRDRYVLVRRYGLNGEKPASFSQIARELNLSRERIRQIEAAALGQLRNSGQLDNFREDA
jgi:RNA polymerase primary sigma factor